jgi:hypothetical protein
MNDEELKQWSEVPSEAEFEAFEDVPLELEEIPRQVVVHSCKERGCHIVEAK